MVIAIAVVAVAVLGLAAIAGAGRLGELPPVVTDRPRGRIPPGRVDRDLLAGLRIPLVSTGYDTRQVDEYLDQAVDARENLPDTVAFDVVRRGYDMQLVDVLVERIGADRRPCLAPYGIMGSNREHSEGLRSANGSDEAPNG